MAELPNFSTPHSHPQSLDSGSTIERMAEREAELGTGSLTCTDHGSLSAARAVYDAAKKHKLTPILGLEGYFRDDLCPILAEADIKADESGTVAHYQKYYHFTTHALSQAAYERMVRILSHADLNRSEVHGQERKPLFGWKELEELLQSEMTLGSGCLVGMVQRHLLGDNPRPDLAVKHYERMRSLVPAGNFYVEVFPHDCSKDWVKAVFLELAAVGDVKPPDRRYWYGKQLRVDVGGEVEELKAYELAARFERWNGHPAPKKVRLLAVKNKQTWTEESDPPNIIFARAVENFLQNECTQFAPDGDVQRAANKFMLALAHKYGDPVLVSDDSHYAYSEDKVVQDVRLLSGERTRTKGSAPQWRFFGDYHRQSSAEAFAHFQKTLGAPEVVFAKWVENSQQWKSRFGWKFQDRKQLPAKFYPEDTFPYLVELIKQTGRMDWSNRAWVERLTAEVKMLRDNGVIDLLPYFFLSQDGIRYYESLGHLPGPGRGSAAGLLLTYLVGITHVEPLRFNLSKERFLTESRIRSGKLPDIDMDFGRETREVLVHPEKGWLKRRFGDHCAQISTDTMLRLKSSIQDVHRMLDGEVPQEVWKLTERMELPPQGITDHDFVFGYLDADKQPVKGSIQTDPALIEYSKTYPQHWAVVSRALGVVKGHGRHASAYVLTNEPVSNFIPVTMVGDVACTAYNMKGVEAAGGIKMDYLGISCLDDIEVAIRNIQKKVGWQPQDAVVRGKKVPAPRVVPVLRRPADGDLAPEFELHDVWDLPDEPEVYGLICSPKHDKSIFQFGTAAAKQWLQEFAQPGGGSTIKMLEDLSAFNALNRPGGLDAFVETQDGKRRNMLQEFAARVAGRPACKGRLAVLDELFPETYGVLVYQEQLQKAFQMLGGTTPEEGDEFRVHVSKKQAEKVMADKAVFMRGAVPKLGDETAEKLWGMMETFAAYGFNKSHSVCYSVIGYACAWLQHHYPLEWWAAVLGNADRNEIDSEFWPLAGQLVDPPDVALSGEEFEVQGDRIRAPLRLLAGIGPAAHAELVGGRPYANLKDFLKRIRDRKAVVGEDGKKGRSDINRGVLARLVVSGCADSLFPLEARGDVFAKLSYLAEAEAEVNDRRYKRTGLLKVEKVDERFMNLSPLQRYILTKGVLPSHSAPLVELAAVDKTVWKQVEGRHMWLASAALDGKRWTYVLPGSAVKMLLEGRAAGIPPKFRFACVAYVSEAESFWGGKAVKVRFEVDGERFEVPWWPRTSWEGGEKKRVPAELPDSAAGGVCVVALSRWDLNKDFSVDEVEVVEPAFSLKAAADD